MEVTLKVYSKSLTTFLEENHLIVNLYSFTLPLASQANLSFPKESHLLPSQTEEHPKLAASFSVNLSFLRISQLLG